MDEGGTYQNRECPSTGWLGGWRGSRAPWALEPPKGGPAKLILCYLPVDGPGDISWLWLCYWDIDAQILHSKVRVRIFEMRF